MANDLTLPRKLGYGIGIFGPMLGWVAALQYLMYFYTDVAGIDPARAGLIFMIGMVWDAVSDPLVGVLTDRTRTRWGRYRPYLLFGSVPFAIVVAFAFFPIKAGAENAFWIALVTHLLFRTGYTIVYMPFTAMIARITTSYDSRTSLTAVKTMFVFLGNLTISFGFYTLVLRLGGGSEGVGFFRAAAVVGVAAALTSLICFAATREAKEDEEIVSAARIPLKTAAPDLLGNKAFLLLFAGVAIFGGFYGAELAMTAYFAKYWLGDAGLARVLFTTQAFASLASIPVWLWLGKRFGKSHVWTTGVLLASAGLFGVFFIRPENYMIMAALYAVANVGASGFILIFYAMTADTVDWGEWVSGRRHEGVIFGAISFANKFAAGVATGFVGVSLTWIGFAANETPSVSVINGMFVIGALIPAIAFVVAASLMRWYPVSREAHQKILAEIENSKA
ncbi:MAG: glycoside-pentoside-hexuronide (GPH):cation symporter [Pseudomonadota bacterium]